MGQSFIYYLIIHSFSLCYDGCCTEKVPTYLKKLLTGNSSRIYMFNAILENFSEILKNLFFGIDEMT